MPRYGPTKTFKQYRMIRVLDPSGIVSFREYEGSSENKFLIKPQDLFFVSEVKGHDKESGIVHLIVVDKADASHELIAYEYAIKDDGFMPKGW